MVSSIVLKLLDVTHYYRNNKTRPWYKPFGYGEDDIDINNVTLHIYQGEALGIIGEPGSSKTLIGRLLAGQIQPDKGKVTRREQVFYANALDKIHEDIKVSSFVRNALSLYDKRVSTRKITKLLKEAELDKDKHTYISDLSDEAYSTLLFVLARASKAKIIILNQVASSLPEKYFSELKRLVHEYISLNQTFVNVDDNIDRVVKVSNYAAWISHGQLRKEGPLSEVIPMFKDHEADRQSLETDEEKAHFDMDWKNGRTRLPEKDYNFKRIERYNHAKPPKFLMTIWLWSFLFLSGMFLTGLLFFNNLGKVDIEQEMNESAISTEQKDPYEEKLAFGIVEAKNVKLKPTKGGKGLTVPESSVLSIVAENSKRYQVEVDGKQYTVKKNPIRFFNPAGLYAEHDVEDLHPYMKRNYVDSFSYFNSHLHKKHKEVTDSLVPEKDKDNRFNVPITEQPINMLFDDQNKVIGFTFPIVDEKKLKDKFNIDRDIWITKSGDGYLLADFENDKWTYIEM